MARVLVIDGEEWVAEMLAGAVREVGHEVTVCGTALAGLDAAGAEPPDCIVCDVDLPDNDGFWVARQVRAMSGPAGVTPILFLSKRGHPKERLQGFHVGGDVWMDKPFRLEEVMAQLAAMVQMATRLRDVRERFSSAPPAAGGPAMSGELSQASITTLLTILEMEQRTGTFEVLSGGRHLRLDLDDGGVSSATIDGASVAGLAGLRAMLGLTEGRFTFTAAPAPTSTAPTKRGAHGRQPLGSLLIKAVRLDDRDGAPDVAPPSAPPRPPPARVQPEGGSIAPTQDEPVEVEPDLSSYWPPPR